MGQDVVMVLIRPGDSTDVDACVQILRELPDHFTPDTYADARDVYMRTRTWVATNGPDVIGFMTVEQRFPHSAEIRYAAVTREHQGSGVGSALLAAAVRQFQGEGVHVLEVKTLDASMPYEPYDATRAFWERSDFVQVDCIDPMPGWGPGNPAAIYVRPLEPPT